MSGCFYKEDAIWDLTYKGITRAALNMDAVILTNGYKVLGNTNIIQANVQCVGVNCENLVE